MTGQLLFGLTFLSALGAGLIAGLFFAFSSFVMTALSRIPSEQGIAAMQAINVAVLNPLFALVFFGTALACIEAKLIPNAVFNPIQSIWGHFAGRGINSADNQFIDDNLKHLLALSAKG